MATRPPEAVARRLALARGSAWALLIAGWLALGELGRTHWPLWIDGLGALVLWLGATGVALVYAQGRRRASAALRWQLVLWGLLCAAALAVLAAGGPGVALALLALAWAALLVTASQAVRVLRSAHAARVQRGRPAPPFGAALAGAALAWAVADQPLVLAAMLVLLPLTLASLLPAQGVAASCRAGLFDCALPLADAPPWRSPAAWPVWAARAAMLPMMAALSGMAAWCSALGWPAPAMTALHLLAMLLPPWLLRQRKPGPYGGAPLVLALAAGVAALVLRPGLEGLMLASLCHALAWGLAWRLALAQPAPAAAVHGAAWRPALAVALLGTALAVAGPVALMVVHAALGSVAVFGAITGALYTVKPAPEIPR